MKVVDGEYALCVEDFNGSSVYYAQYTIKPVSIYLLFSSKVNYTFEIKTSLFVKLVSVFLNVIVQVFLFRISICILFFS